MSKENAMKERARELPIPGAALAAESAVGRGGTVAGARRSMGAFLLLAAAAAGCGLVSFDVEQPIPEQTIPGSPLGALLPPGLFSLPLQVDLESSTKAHGTGAASSAHLKALTLTITDPPGETFAFLDGITITISAAGQTPRQIATLMPVPKTSSIDLKPEPNVDLLPYIKSGATISATATGRTPARDVKLNGKVVINIKV
jgi:hypothetical protein